MTIIGKRHRLMARASAVVLVIIAAKLAIHAAGWEALSINALFSGIVAANVFLMGFLLSGVMSDYKESERLPGEFATSLENLAEDVRGIALVRPDAPAGACLALLGDIGRDTLAWLYKKHRTGALLDHVNALTVHFAALEPCTQPAFIVRLKHEQGNLRRIVMRIHTIRETSFVASGYLLADAITVLLCLGLVLARIEPFYESLFFVGVISYVMVFLLLLIRDLDNPFGYYENGSAEDVSLKPIVEAAGRLRAMAAESAGAARIETVEPAESQPSR